VNSINLAKNIDWWQAFESMVMNIRVSSKAGNFLAI
jgi:hypothetical protein